MNGTRGKSVHKVGGRETGNQMAKILQCGDGMGTCLDVLCHCKSHISIHSRIKSEMKKRTWHG